MTSKVNSKGLHPKFFVTSQLIFNVLIACLGAIIGLELVTRIGITPNTSIIGALVAIIISYIPFKCLSRFKRLENQTLVQTTISGASFSAANGLLLPIAIPFLMGQQDMLIPMLVGASLAVITDASILYFSFDSKLFSARNAWPPGFATAEALKAAAGKGKSAVLLVFGMIGGAVGKSFGIPTEMLGIAWISNIFALSALGIGLLLRGYSDSLFGVDINSLYIPHGIMIGAGLVALCQIIKLVKNGSSSEDGDHRPTRSALQMKKALGTGFTVYLTVALSLALVTGIYTDMSIGMLILWVVFAAFAAIASEMIVGIAAMHSGWFPAFATGLIFLVLGMLIGFPNEAIGVLVAFTVATGPAFADMAYDLKAGWVIRGESESKEYELEGRKQQYFAELFSFGVAILIVAFVHQFYFDQNLVPPVARVYVATIEAGADANIAKMLALWALVGAAIQLLGGISRQIGVLLATGLLILSPKAGIMIFVGLSIRFIVGRILGEDGKKHLYVLGAGAISGSALYSFFTSTLKLGSK
ncbi:OPT/YSL family transporter [Aliivibrio fischeri]|uniref:OPT/YSL family transporter n=1 Tax=Aliivibrio fischeri TaxID=668 RepID=UPI0012DAD554|nr:OPT/YSL family transporter [Aliivibrio fischeri]MUK68922.1 OPT family oligopeptide transporter [Aliivibrio fischeri]MUK73381.1 OPT family oligopeptide transporter [Aliivibrio fischeri]